ncbi:DGQHR domain-containing protein [Oceaniglobus indicus]|uniref:DGQHR domain-containing protein n=1 Tax=Oceaniglobus indicus TaxID=2047749 RepID=UPI000C17F54D|nr:DGQHR domain-containing protein [Oceaniglobus indicus]
MNNNSFTPIVLPVSKVSQPIGDFYVGRLDARTLVNISYTEIRAFLEGTQEKIAGIQRERSPKRIEEIKKYVNLDYATFPTSIIIAVSPECARLVAYDPDMTSEEAADLFEQADEQGLADDSKVFSLLLNAYGNPGDDDFIPSEKIAFIIDGQHRVAGLEGLDDGREFDVNISVFVGASDADKAEIFARVNQAQTKVNQSLVVDLASYYEERGPVKFAHEVVLAMNQDDEGPFLDKIKRLGKADPGKGRTQTLAQATVVKPIVDYITSDPEAERNKRYRGIFSSRRKPDEWRKFIFQPFYDNQDDSGMFLCLTNYFGAVKARWPDVWDEAPAGTILNRTTGYAALMRFLRPVYLNYCSGPGQILTRADCDKVFAKIDIDAMDLNRDEYLPGSSGIGKLYRNMMAEMGWKA